MPNNREYHTFQIPGLEKYSFYINRDLFYGYDRKGVIWQEPELTEMQEKGAIVKNTLIKLLFPVVNGQFLGIYKNVWMALCWQALHISSRKLWALSINFMQCDSCSR